MVQVDFRIMSMGKVWINFLLHSPISNKLEINLSIGISWGLKINWEIEKKQTLYWVPYELGLKQKTSVVFITDKIYYF